jgi:hypothetical protein
MSSLCCWAKFLKSFVSFQSKTVESARTTVNIATHRDNERVKTCAKIAIVRSIVESEKKSKIFVDETKHPRQFRDRAGFMKSWLRDFIYILQEGIVAKETLKDIGKNITIINFNYDRCIEHCLFRVLQELYLIDEVSAAEIVNSLKIYHPYGKVASLPWQSNGGIPFGGGPFELDQWLSTLAKNIRTFNEEVDDGKQLQQIGAELGNAANVVFLGFHFHKQNLELLKPTGDKKIRHIFATLKDRSGPEVDIITRRVEALFQPIAIHTATHFLQEDCKTLFREYGTTISE